MPLQWEKVANNEIAAKGICGDYSIRFSVRYDNMVEFLADFRTKSTATDSFRRKYIERDTSIRSIMDDLDKDEEAILRGCDVFDKELSECGRSVGKMGLSMPWPDYRND